MVSVQPSSAEGLPEGLEETLLNRVANESAIVNLKNLSFFSSLDCLIRTRIFITYYFVTIEQSTGHVLVTKKWWLACLIWIPD